MAIISKSKLWPFLLLCINAMSLKFLKLAMTNSGQHIPSVVGFYLKTLYSNINDRNSFKGKITYKYPNFELQVQII